MTSSHSNFKCFFYSIPELSIRTKIVSVNIVESRTGDDLKKIIASELNISDSQLRFKNPPDQELKNLDTNKDIELIFTCIDPDIYIIFPNKQKYLIKDCYKMKFKDIIRYIENEGLFFSNSFLTRVFHIYYEGNELPRDKQALLSATKNSILEVKMTGNFVELNYANFRFFFSENEYHSDVENLIKKVVISKFPVKKNLFVKIHNSRGIKPINLKSSENYKMNIDVLYGFYYDKYNRFSFFSDFMSTFLDIQKSLSKELANHKLHYQPENLVICDNKNNEITDPTKPLCTIQSLDMDFIFKIDKNRKSQIDPKSDKKSSELESKDSPKPTSGSDVTSPKKVTHEPKYAEFSFYFNKLMQKLTLDIESPIIACEKKVKEVFKIDENKKITFSIFNDIGKQEVIKNKEEKMISFWKKQIFVHITTPKNKSNDQPTETETKAASNDGFKCVKFYHVDEKSYVELTVSSSITISKAVKELSDDLFVDNKSVKSEDLIIYDEEGNEIEISEKLLESVQSLNKNFYYEIGQKIKTQEEKKILVTFYNLKNYQYKEKILLNNSSTVLDAVKEIFLHLRARDQKIKIENIFLYDINKSKLLDPNKTLSSIQELKHYFLYNINKLSNSTLISMQELGSPERNSILKKDKKDDEIPLRKFCQFSLEYNGKIKIKEMNVAMTFKVYEQIIKNEFNIDEDDDILFTYAEKNKKEKLIENYELKMDSFKNGIIKLYRKIKSESKDKDISDETPVADIKERNVKDERKSPLKSGKSMIVFADIRKIVNKSFTIDNTSTIFDAVKILSDKLSTPYDIILPENLFIYDSKKKPITDPNLPITRIQNIDKKFYFLVDKLNKSTFKSEKVEKVSNSYEKESPKKEVQPSKFTLFQFEYKGILHKKKLDSHFKLNHLIPFFKKALTIDEKEELIFTFISNERTEKKIEDTNVTIDSFKEGVVRISLKSKEEEEKSPEMQKLVKFIDHDKGIYLIEIEANLVPTIPSALKVLASKLSGPNTIIKPEYLVLYSASLDDITHSTKSLNQIQKLDKTFFFIIKKIDKTSPNRAVPVPSEAKESIKVIIVFDKESFGNKLYPMRKNISLDMSVLELKKMIVDEIKIIDPIVIKHKLKTSDSFAPLDSSSKISEIKDKIEEKNPNGRSSYYLYVGIIGKPAKPSTSFTSDAGLKPKDEHEKVRESPLSTKKDSYSPKNRSKSPEMSPAKTPSEAGTIAKVEHKRRLKSATSFKPKIKPIDSSPEKEKYVSSNDLYTFEYNGTNRRLKCDKGSTLISNEEMIKEEFEIDLLEKISFTFSDEIVKDLKKKMNSFKGGIIHISIVKQNQNAKKEKVKPVLKSKFKPKIRPQDEPDKKVKPKNEIKSTDEPDKKVKPKQPKSEIKSTDEPDKKVKPKSETKSTDEPDKKVKPKSETKSTDEPDPKPKIDTKIKKMVKYFYNVMNDDNNYEIELGSEATVKNMKEKIADLRGIGNISVMKIIFAGKELLDELVLEPMEIGDFPLFVYHPPVEEVLLKTAKALVYNNIYDDDDESEDEGNNNDDDDDDDDLY